VERWGKITRNGTTNSIPGLSDTRTICSFGAHVPTLQAYFTGK